MVKKGLTCSLVGRVIPLGNEAVGNEWERVLEVTPRLSLDGCQSCIS